LIKLSHSQWNDVSTLMKQFAVRWADMGLPSSTYTCTHKCEHENVEGDPSRANITSLVQVLTMRTVLWVMFDMKDQHDTCNMSLLNLAQAINRTWLASKSCRESKIPKFGDHPALRQCLFNVFGYYPSSPDDNPLNLIIPAFETTWRVVLQLFLEIEHGAASQREWQSCMIEFSRTPTRRIYLACQLSRGLSASPQILAVDIEGCHIRSDIWGPEA
jgi:hypothetical protein